MTSNLLVPPAAADSIPPRPDPGFRPHGVATSPMSSQPVKRSEPSHFFLLLTAPVIWLCLPPLALLDVVGSLYQAICFPIYRIPKVRRRDYLHFDRSRLRYLDPFDKINCEYCAYANGLLAWFTEIAARTEQYWCPIRHAKALKSAHSRYRHFLPYDDAAAFRDRFPTVRRAFDDLIPPAAPTPSAPRPLDPNPP